jgi:exodeoxyribonuclease I
MDDNRTSAPEGASFYWYDYETFGLDRRFDRPAQFAGIRTDLDFKPIGEPDLFYDKPSFDTLPNPQSCLITGITPQLCAEKGLAESEFAAEVWSRFNKPGTMSIGYNSLGFDNEVSRFLFWRNFLEPYTHQWKDGCSVWDLYPFTAAVWALRGEGIRWPTWEEVAKIAPQYADHKPGVCFKLEFLSRFNNIEHAHAHDALSDVEATIGMARLLRDRAPKLWDWALDHRSKKAVNNALDAGPVIWISPRFPQERGRIVLGRRIAMNPENASEAWVWNLAYDPAELSGISAEDFRRRAFGRREELAEGEKPLPVYKLKTNASPFVCSSLRVLPADKAAAYGLDIAAALENSRRLEAMGHRLQELSAEIGALPEEGERPVHDVDAGLYDGGFPSEADRGMMARVRRCSPEQLAERAASGGLVFEDPRFNELLFRFRARSWPETLTDEELARWRRFCASRLIEGAEPKVLTVSDYFEMIDAIRQNTDDGDEKTQELLEMLYSWGESAGEFCSGD